MARIKTRTLFFDPSPAADVVGYRVYYITGSGLPTYDAQFKDIGLVTEAQLDLVVGPADDSFSFGVSALDEAGGESDIYQNPDWVGVPLDLDPPAAPSGGGLRVS